VHSVDVCSLLSCIIVSSIYVWESRLLVDRFRHVNVLPYSDQTRFAVNSPSLRRTKVSSLFDIIWALHLVLFLYTKRRLFTVTNQFRFTVLTYTVICHCFYHKQRGMELTLLGLRHVLPILTLSNCPIQN
jgi:hypothetical protein